MATSSFPWNQVNTMVQDYIVPTIADQIFLSNAGFNRMKGRIKTFTGGRRIVVPLGWRTQGGLKWFSGTDVFSPTVRDPFQAAEFVPKNANIDLTIDWDEEMSVSGPEQVMDLMESKGEWARNTMFDGFANELYNDGSEVKAMSGLEYSLKDATGTTASPTPATVTYGIISRGAATNTWWNPQCDPSSPVYLTGAAGSPGFAGDNFLAISRMFARIKLASGKAPTLILSNVGSWADVHYNLTKATTYMRPQQNSDLFKAGFENFIFRTAVWVQDEKAPRTTDANKDEKVYFLYEPGIRLYVDTRANFAFEPFRKPHNQMARTAYILWRGELVVSEPRAQGKIQVVRTSSVS